MDHEMLRSDAFEWTSAFETAAPDACTHGVEPPLPDAREVLRLANLERLGILAPETF